MNYQIKCFVSQNNRNKIAVTFKQKKKWESYWSFKVFILVPHLIGIMSEQARADLGHFIIDLQDEECPSHELHLAAYKNDVTLLGSLLEKDDYRQNINARIRPFLSTPLRLAATGLSTECKPPCDTNILFEFLLIPLSY